MRRIYDFHHSLSKMAEKTNVTSWTCRSDCKNSYQNATKLMNAKKKELMGTTITKIVKPGNKYAPGGLVEGRPKTVKEGQKGTIVEEVEDGVYEIEWDDPDLPNCQVEKRHLRLQTGLTQTYTWKFVEHHVADNPPTEYRKHGLIGLSSKKLEVPPTIPNKGNPEEPLPNPEYSHRSPDSSSNYGQVIGATSSQILTNILPRRAKASSKLIRMSGGLFGVSWHLLEEQE
jgi:hypothetical protein